MMNQYELQSQQPFGNGVIGLYVNHAVRLSKAAVISGHFQCKDDPAHQFGPGDDVLQSTGANFVCPWCRSNLASK